MLDALRFVQGAVSRKDYVPALTHFLIRGSRVTGYNGKMSLSAPLPLDVDCCPKAMPFVRAIEACTETAQLSLTPSGKLSIRSGKFRAHVETLEEAEYPEVAPEGDEVAVDGELLPALALLYNFVAQDASRPWATGVLLDGQSAFATNNVVLVQRWLGYRFPFRVTLPRYAVKEMLRIGEEPLRVQLTGTSATFHYSGERWLRTQLNSAEWPDAAGLLDKLPMDCKPVPAGLFDALDVVAPFTDELNRVLLRDGHVATADTDGTSVEVPGLPEAGAYNLKMLRSLADTATHIGFHHYPDTVPFYGAKLRGAIAGLRS